MKANLIGREPVIVQALATIVVWAATRYGLQISDEQALQIAGVAFVVLAPFVRQLVQPIAKEEAPLTEEEMAHARELLDTRARLAKIYRSPVERGGYPSGATRVDQMPPPSTGVKAPADPAKPPVP